MLAHRIVWAVLVAAVGGAAGLILGTVLVDAGVLSSALVPTVIGASLAGIYGVTAEQ